MGSLLELQHVSAGYGEDRVLKDVSLSVEEGEFVGVIGPNGSGKTTLLRVMVGALRVLEGRVLLDGRDVASLSSCVLASEVAYMPQRITVPYGTRCVDMVAMGRFPHSGRFSRLSEGDVRIVMGAMDRMGVRHLASRFVSSLSGGEVQRVLLAQVLAQTSRLLLMDEPTAHLDLTHRLSILRILADLNETEGMTIVMVVHDLNLASEFCSRLVLVSDGKVVRTGEPRCVITSEVLSEVYRSPVCVHPNPLTGRPMVVVSRR